MNPKVKIDNNQGLAENRWNINGKYWAAANLVAWCKEKNYPVFKLPLAAVDLSNMPWNVDSLDEFIWQMKRVEDTDLKYPIILDDFGRICDGYHRVCKAILENKTEIDAVRIEEMPGPDGYEKD